MASRIIAQILVVGGGYFVRAFVEAYRQALQAAPAHAAGARQAARSLKHKLTLEEAAEILSVRKDAGLKDISERFEKLYTSNDPSKGGSQYLQYKILSARNALVESAVERGEKLSEDQSAGGADASSASNSAR
mmetsp:Transcript_4462/g.12171  ORF Transcript_4462/g.12171 Transcript_4462/m.12171 type:complete len:133 (-) Transcript_4462:2370-2768(-)